MAATENAARLAGVGLLGAFGAGLLEHSVGDSIGGVRLHDVHDAAVVATYYGHPEIRVVAWLCAGLLFFLGLFGGAMRAHMKAAHATLWADVFAIFVAADVALLMVHYGLDMAMVDLVPIGRNDALLAVFASWDGIYAGVTEWIELGWMAALTIGCRRSSALPRWLVVGGALVCLSLVGNGVVRLARLPESALIPGYTLFGVWMVVASVVLIRRGR